MTQTDYTLTPILPRLWRNTYLLFPFGDLPEKTRAGEHYKQLMIADVSYEHRDDGGSAMVVDLVEFETRKTASFLFVSLPNSPTAYFIIERHSLAPGAPYRLIGPFSTEVRVPDRDAFRHGETAARFAGNWFTGLVEAAHFVTPEHAHSEGKDITFGSWLAYERGSDGPNGNGVLPWRLLNLGAHNPLRLPVIGSYFQALGNEWQGTVPDEATSDLFANLEAHIAKAEPLPEGAEPEFDGGGLRDQRQLQAYMATSPYLTRCDDKTLECIAPGLSSPKDDRLPEWTHQVQIEGMTIGQALRPYRTEVYYNDQFDGEGVEGTPGRQLSRFFNYSQDATFAEGVRQDEFLEASDTQIFEYVQKDDSYRLSCKMTLPGIGFPRRDFPKRFGGTKPAVLHGGHFFVPEGRTLSIVVSGNLPRPMASPTPDTASIFWWFFYEHEGADHGVFFSECDFHTPQYHDLSVIDYSRFEPNAPVELVNRALNGMPRDPVPTCGQNKPSDKW